MRSFAGVQPLRGEDAVAASVRKMSNQEADECAALIVEIFGRAVPRRSRPRSARHERVAVVQLRSVDCAPAEFEVPALIATN